MIWDKPHASVSCQGSIAVELLVFIAVKQNLPGRAREEPPWRAAERGGFAWVGGTVLEPSGEFFFFFKEQLEWLFSDGHRQEQGSEPLTSGTDWPSPSSVTTCSLAWGTCFFIPHSDSPGGSANPQRLGKGRDNLPVFVQV